MLIKQLNCMSGRMTEDTPDSPSTHVVVRFMDWDDILKSAKKHEQIFPRYVKMSARPNRAMRRS